jgi:hypothetical protein
MAVRLLPRAHALEKIVHVFEVAFIPYSVDAIAVK